MSSQKISVETTVAAPIEEVWRAYTTPEDIKQWNSPSDDWHTPAATVDLREGGAFLSRMEAKDGSAGFDFVGTYTKVALCGGRENLFARTPARGGSRRGGTSQVAKLLGRSGDAGIA